MTWRNSVAILLSSGVETGGFCARVVEGGEYIELVFRWPAPIVHTELLRQKWLSESVNGNAQIEAYHPKIVRFQNALPLLRRQAADNVEFTVSIPLPFAVQTDIEEKFNHAWRDSIVRILYLGFKAVVQSYAIVKDSDEFEVV